MSDDHIVGFFAGFVVILIILTFINIIEPNNITYHKVKMMEYSCEFNGFELEEMWTGDFINQNERYECSDGVIRRFNNIDNDERDYIYSKMRE